MQHAEPHMRLAVHEELLPICRGTLVDVDIEALDETRRRVLLRPEPTNRVFESAPGELFHEASNRAIPLVLLPEAKE